MSDERTRPQDPSDLPTGDYPALRRLEDPLIGRVLKGNYRIDDKLAEGGMGVVYKATQLNLGRAVAVKTILPGFPVRHVLIDRFLREAQLLAQLHHPNIVHILDFGSESGGLLYMVMEHLAGESLESFVEGGKRLTGELILALMEQIAAAIAAAHEKGVIHRDLKPANIMVMQVTGSPRPVVKVLDFGLGKVLRSDDTAGAGLTRQGVMMGTCGYSPPEQMQGAEVDARADIYGLGAILYHLVAGRPPFHAEGLHATLQAQLTQPPDPFDAKIDLPQREEIYTVVVRALSANPADRYQTVSAFLSDLQAVLRRGETISDRGMPSRSDHLPGLPGTRRGAARPWKPWLAAGLAGVLLVAVMAWWLLHPRRRATAPGVTPDEIVLGLTGPFTGPTKELGRAIQTGIETYLNHINDHGGVHGRRVRLVALDDGYEPSRAAENMRQLLEEYQVFGFIGNVGTPTTEAALPLALENRRVLFAPYTGAAFLRREPPDRYVFNYRASYAEETAAIVHYLVDVRKIRPDQIAVLSQNDSFGETGFAGVARALRKHGHDPNRTLRVRYERNRQNVTTAVETIVAARDRVRAIVMVATYQPAATFIRQVRDAGLEVVFTNVSFVGSEALAERLRELGPRYCDGVIVTQVVPHYHSGATGVLRYREHLKKYYPNEPPGFVSLEGYIAAAVLVEGLRQAGVELTAETLVDGLEKIRDLDLAIGTRITFGPSDHQGSHKVWGTVLDGKGIYRDLDLD